MDFSAFHFSKPYWLFLLLALPLYYVASLYLRSTFPVATKLNQFIDSKLMPYLLINPQTPKSSRMRSLGWPFAWLCMTLALAGPRWSYRDIDSYSLDKNLVILLDISDSMNSKDVKPSRLELAKQKIEDMLSISEDTKIALIAFAADPHILAPLTEDKKTIRQLLPSITTDLAYIQGSRLSSSLEMASSLLNHEQGSNKSILVISDGGFEDPSALSVAKTMSDKGIVIYVMGVGTTAGAPLQDHNGQMIKKNGSTAFSKLDREKLADISRVGKGQYLEAGHAGSPEAAIFHELKLRATAQVQQDKKTRLWDEHFYLVLIPAIPIFLFWFRKGALTVLVLFLTSDLGAFEISTLFKNSEEQAFDTFTKGNYEEAAVAFEDNYRKGVASYRAGNYVEAEKYFKASTRKNVAERAEYNLGNTLVQQNKLQEAVAVYESLLEKWPENTKAKENLELLKQLLEQQSKEQNQSDSSDKNDKDQQDSSEKNDTDSSDKNKNNQNDSSDKNDKDQQDSSKKNDTDSSDKNDKDQQDSSEKNDTDSSDKNDKDQQYSSEKNDTDSSDKNDKDQQYSSEKNDTDSSDKNKNNQKDQSDNLDKLKHDSLDKNEQDEVADQWLNRLENNPKEFLRNKFYIESKKNGTKEGLDPW